MGGQTSCQVGLAEPYSHNTDIESGNGLVCRTTNIRTDSVTTSEAAWNVFAATVIAASLDTAAQRRAAPVVRPTTKLDVDVAPCRT